MRIYIYRTNVLPRAGYLGKVATCIYIHTYMQYTYLTYIHELTHEPKVK